jgi:hypothetical protein
MARRNGEIAVRPYQKEEEIGDEGEEHDSNSLRFWPRAGPEAENCFQTLHTLEVNNDDF